MDNRKVPDKELMEGFSVLVNNLFPIKSKYVFQLETLTDDNTMYDNDLFARISVFYKDGEHYGFTKFYRRKVIESALLILLGMFSPDKDEKLTDAQKVTEEALMEWLAGCSLSFKQRRMLGEGRALFTDEGTPYVLAFINAMAESVQNIMGDDYA